MKYSLSDRLSKIKHKLLSSCELCKGSGHFNNLRCECLKEFEKYVMYSYSGIAEEYWRLSKADWEGDGIALDQVLRYIQHLDNAYEHGLGLILFDTQNGTGKTFLASLVLKRAIEKKYRVKFIVLSEMLSLIKQFTPESQEDFNKNIREADLLCLDNVGSEYRPADFGAFCRAIVDELVRFRDRHKLPTILTTNLLEKDIYEIYGRNVSSLLEGKCKRIQVLGEDFRKRKKFNYDRLLRGEESEL